MHGKRLVKAGEAGSLAIVYCCDTCEHAPKDDVAWFHVEVSLLGRKVSKEDHR